MEEKKIIPEKQELLSILDKVDSIYDSLYSNYTIKTQEIQDCLDSIVLINELYLTLKYNAGFKVHIIVFDDPSTTSKVFFNKIYAEDLYNSYQKNGIKCVLKEAEIERV